MSKEQRGWAILPHQKEWRNSLDKEADSEYKLSMGDLDMRYSHFCSYAHEDSFRKRIFECWGRMHKYRSEYRHKGFMQFTDK